MVFRDMRLTSPYLLLIKFTKVFCRKLFYLLRYSIQAAVNNQQFQSYPSSLATSQLFPPEVSRVQMYHYSFLLIYETKRFFLILIFPHTSILQFLVADLFSADFCEDCLSEAD